MVAGYNPWGTLAGTSRSNATLTNYGYDGVQRPNAYYHDLGGGAADGLWTFARNPAGQIGSTTRTNDAYAWTSHYAVTRPYTTDGLNRYITAGAPGPGQATFGYDLNGNLTSDGSRTFDYDVENRLIWASGTPTTALVYDPLGRLFQLTHGGNTTTFLYDGDALVAEYNTAGTMTRRYVHWTGADVPMLSYADTALTQLSQLHADERGSIIAVTDAAGAATPNRYDEYGIPASTNSGRFQYTGQIWLNELGMYHYKARVYSPYLGRFLQVDPIGYEDQFNLYAYVGNDPINAADPTGLMCFRNGRDPGDGCELGDSNRPPNLGDSAKGSDRPHRAEPGGPISEEQAACRSCHGIITSPTQRYTTEAENELLADVATLIIPWARISRVAPAAQGIARWLGAGYTAKTLPSGNRVFQSADGLRRFRIDVIQRRGTFRGPHAQFESRRFTNRPYEPVQGIPRHIYFRAVP